jgi:hypothetical protein
MARCVIPASQLAVEHLRIRFSQGRSDQAYDPAPGTSSCSEEVVVSGVVDGGLQGMAVAYDDECPSGRCTCDPSFWDPDWAGGHCECYSNDGMCSPLIPLDPIVNDPVCGGWGTFWNSVTEECECIDSSHEMDAHGDCVATSDPTIPPPDDPPPEPDCSDPLNPECEDGGTNPPPPPPPAEDPMTITLTLSPAEVAPGGVTEVTVQVEPAQAGVPVDVWTSASGDGVGVFGESSDLTDENGVFSTTYTAGSTVQVETIWASATNNDGELIEASADLTVVEPFEASLECDTGVTRGESGGCTLSVNDASRLDEIIRWKFEAASLGLDSITSPHSGSTWDGNLVSSGTVTAFFRTTDGTEHDRSDHLYIEPRQWSWGSADWNFLPGGIPGGQTYLEQNEPLTSSHAQSGLTLGIWCRNRTCTGASFLRPDYRNAETGGYQTGQIDGGPNDGLFFVTSASFGSDTGNAVHPHIYASSGHMFANMASCTDRNWYNGNVCNGISTSTLNELITGVENHEAFGSTGTNGHESRARLEAARFDPHQAIEDLVNWSESGLRQNVETTVISVRDQLESALHSLAEPTGNFGPRSVYFQDGAVWRLLMISGG